ncbi:ATP synthase subunit b, sodium ion specific [bioreactor metagenome]|uniref:ATP synthase subunit b, sodium ion specific n=1 Tax=bioreactor metagenome TaxID=1076179 RepID=A0A644YPA4_9ZZZZ
MTFHWIDIVEHILNIIVLFVILRALLYKPVLSFMKKREQGFEKQRQDINHDMESAQKLKSEYENSLAGARSEAQETIREGVQRADTSAKEILEKAEQEGKALLAQAREQAQREQREVETAMKNEVTALAVGLATKILEREISLEDNREIIEQYFSKVG